MRRLRPMAAALSAAAIVVTALPAPAHAAAPARGKAPGIAWGECPPPPPDSYRDPRQECATVKVPLDYRKPHGRTIDVEISRIATSTPARHRGVLLSNPGGPGGSGLDLPGALATLLPAEVLDQYDLIGFDPRGIGHSTPVSCGVDMSPTSVTLHLPYPSPDGDIARNVAFAQRTAAECARRNGPLLPHITTANTARDMDRIRALLGEPKISYYGGSYGSYLGAVYTSLYPQRSDRIILDSGVDPDLVWRDMWRTWNAAVTERIEDFYAYAATYPELFGLGATPAAVRSTYSGVVKALDATPLDLGDGLVLDGNYLREVTRSLLYADFYLPLLGTLVAELVPVTQGTSADLPSVATALRATGALRDPAVEVPADNQISALYSVVCNDAVWPGSVARHARDVAAARRSWPLLNGMPSNVWPCAFWPTKPVEPPVAVTDRGPRNVLVLQNTRDPATPWTSGVGLREALGKRAAFVGVDQGGHGVFALGTCADAVVVEFLATGALPARDRFCEGVAPPSPLARSLTARPYLPVGPLDGSAALFAAAAKARGTS
ncbi:alpha/beta hydrolase [Luedemannella helvata]|uniref:Alpha/beta hydrolase n=2 Tax=Luedemannella helvata TaxID=349315 RepID=A0ABN2KH04_9ACTN